MTVASDHDVTSQCGGLCLSTLGFHHKTDQSTNIYRDESIENLGHFLARMINSAHPRNLHKIPLSS